MSAELARVQSPPNFRPGLELHYPGGDYTGELVGQLVGPDTAGRPLVIYAADYDTEHGRNVAHVRVATQPEVDAELARWAAPAALRREGA